MVTFHEKYAPPIVMARKEEEFINLKQATKTVAEYEARFAKLSKYAAEMVNTDLKRRNRFVQGLKVEIKNALASSDLTSYAAAVEKAQKIEEAQAELTTFQSRKRDVSPAKLRPTGRCKKRTWVKGEKVTLEGGPQGSLAISARSQIIRKQIAG